MKFNDLLNLISHLLVACLVAFGHKAIEEVPTWVQITLLVVLVILIVIVLRAIKNKTTKNEVDEIRTQFEEEKGAIQCELEKQDRYNHLRKAMLDVIGDFIRERYRANYSLTVDLKRLIDGGLLTVENVQASLKQADDIRREKVKQALGRASQILKEDLFKKPTDADGENKDKMGVSFYAVVTKADGTEFLEKRYRAFPNEGEPKTPGFKLNEGAAGKSWARKAPVICEMGGADPEFEEMWVGQKSDYASMACFPATADFPKEKISEVYGVLTVHSTEREGYFEKHLAQFWFDVFQPLCDALIYSGKSSELIEAISQSFLIGVNSNKAK